VDGSGGDDRDVTTYDLFTVHVPFRR
jgi:hypothetical protein